MTTTADGAAKRSQTEVVVSSILGMVDAGRLHAGDRLPIEKDLAEQLGVSRGSLREGVRALAVLGVLETRQGDGTYVSALDASTLLGPLTLFADRQMNEDPSQLMHVRRVLESESAALAARLATDDQLAAMEALLRRVDDLVGEVGATGDPTALIEADTAFHRAIAEAAGIPLLAALIDSLAGRTTRTRVWRALTDHGATASTQREHRAILDELRRRDPHRARLRMEVHLLAVEDFAAAHPIAGAAPGAVGEDAQ